LSGDVARLLASSSREAVLRLSPPELGEVTVRVAVSGRDVSAWFGTPLPSVQQTISLAIGQLQTDLGNAGYTLNGAWVGADASGSGSEGTGAFVSAPARPAGASQDGPAAVSAALPSASGVSIYV
jgi:flagellar hook-length control protein FliK